MLDFPIKETYQKEGNLIKTTEDTWGIDYYSIELMCEFCHYRAINSFQDTLYLVELVCPQCGEIGGMIYTGQLQYDRYGSFREWGAYSYGRSHPDKSKFINFNKYKKDLKEGR